MIDALKRNVQEIKKLNEKLNFLYSQNYAVKSPKEQKVLKSAIDSTINQIKILNSSLPDLIKDISIAKKLPVNSSVKEPKPTNKKIIQVSYQAGESKKTLVLNKKDKERYLKELSILESSLKELKKNKIIEKTNPEAEFKKPRGYAKISNKLFSEVADRLIKKGYFKYLSLDLRKAELNVMLKTYISMIYFSMLLSFFAGIILFIFFLFFNFNPVATPMISASTDSFLIRFFKVIWIIPGIPILVFVIGYFYPSTEKEALAKKINYELPFVTIQMSAIASSGIEPSQIFKIIALSKEYPAIKKEAKRIMNQINLYGYNLVNALRNVSSATPSKKFSELLNGFSTTITSGGSLTNFLEERAKSLLFEYKLDMEKYIKNAESFMDIYISVVIAAPMMMMLILIIMSMTQMGLGLGIGTLTLIIVMIVAVINLVLLVFLHINQRKF